MVESIIVARGRPRTRLKPVLHEHKTFQHYSDHSSQPNILPWADPEGLSRGKWRRLGRGAEVECRRRENRGAEGAWKGGYPGRFFWILYFKVAILVPSVGYFTVQLLHVYM